MPFHPSDRGGVRKVRGSAGLSLGGGVLGPRNPARVRPQTGRSAKKVEPGGARPLSGSFEPPRAPSYGGLHHIPLQARIYHYRVGEARQAGM